MKIKKGDKVRVLQGKDAGKEGEVMFAFPRKGVVIVEGVNLVKKHQRPAGENSPGGIIDKDMPMDASNVMFVHKGETVRLGYAENNKGEKVRIARPSGEEI